MNNAENRAGASAPAIDRYFKPDVSPETVFQAIGRLRKEARDEIDRLLQFLDESDGHMEREPDGDELDASYPEGGAHHGAGNEDDEDGADDEPSLGFQNSIVQTTIAICGGGRNDMEDEHDGREPEDYGGEAVHEDDENEIDSDLAMVVE